MLRFCSYLVLHCSGIGLFNVLFVSHTAHPASEFGQQFRNFSKRAGFFYMPQSWDMGQIILLPLRRKECCVFFQQEKSDGFGRERTRDLGDSNPQSQEANGRRLVPRTARPQVSASDITTSFYTRRILNSLSLHVS
jgi:hypothetical protein